MAAPQTDIISVAIALVGAAIGNSLAPYVGPYVVIAIAGAIGASCFALPRMEPTDNRKTFGFVLAMTFFACLLTVGAAEAIQSYAHLESRWTLAPIALIIGGIGHDWITVGKWVVSFIGRVFERRAGVDGAKND